MPAARDDKDRPAFVPESVLKLRSGMEAEAAAAAAMRVANGEDGDDDDVKDDDEMGTELHLRKVRVVFIAFLGYVRECLNACTSPI